ncbi:MAG: hypothetical protein ACI8RA_001748 [Chlamydiales bacterium]
MSYIETLLMNIIKNSKGRYGIEQQKNRNFRER